nr:TlpA disulfide reductase family protein [Wocania arenilitoris]
MLCVLYPIIFLGQIKVSEKIQDSYLATQDENALYFIDFWATWCTPCIHVSKYLEILQAQHPNNFYILSLSQENPDIVKRFMKKHKINLAVAIDYKGETFKKNNIQTLPYGILYNAQGKKLWEGHPAEFKTFHIQKFLNKNIKKITVSKMFELQSDYTEVTLKPLVPKADFEYANVITETYGLQVAKELTHLEVQGTLQWWHVLI